MIRRAINLPYLVLVGALGIAVLGVVAYKQLPADLLPIYETPAVQILTLYPGMPPEIMERDIMSRFERWTGQSVGIEHQEARAMPGVSIVKDFFHEDITLATAMSQVSSYAVSDMYYQPPGTMPPMVMPFDPTASRPLCLVSVSSPTMTEKELYDVAYYELRNRLQSVQGVIAPAVYGGKLRRIFAYVDREKLEAHEMSPMDVVRALREQSVYVPSGNIKAGNNDYQIFADAMPKKVAELNDVPIGKHDGEIVYMRDVASVQDTSQIQTNAVRVNGRRQVYIPIYRQPGANTIEIVDSIEAKLARIKKRLVEMQSKAEGIALEVVLDKSVTVRDSINGLQIAALLGAGLAGLVVFLFLRRWRPTLIIVLAIPLSILTAIVGLWAFDRTINALTLAGIALAIGILIDQSIVVVENIIRHRQLGKERWQAALDGTREVAPSIVVATLTFGVVFLPIVFLSGMAKYLFVPLALSAGLVMLASLVVALTLVPSFCARFLRRAEASEGDQAQPAGMQRYRRILGGAIRWRWPLLGLTVLAAAGAALLMTRTGTELFPKTDTGQFRVFVRLPSGTRIEQTEKVVAQVENVVMDELGEPDPKFPAEVQHPDSDLKMLISNIGVLMDWPAAYTPNMGPMDAFMLVQMKETDDRPAVDTVVPRLRERLHEEFPGVQFAFDSAGMISTALNFGERAPIHFQVMGSDLHTLDEIARKVANRVSRVEGARDVRVLQRNDYPTFQVDIDRTAAAKVGLTTRDIMENLVTATNSSVNIQKAFWIDESSGNHYFMGAQYPESDHVSAETLLNIPITPEGGGEAIPLRNVAEISRGTGPAMVSHRNITRVFDVYATVAPDANMGQVVSAMEKELAGMESLGLTEAPSERGRTTWDVGGEYKGRGYTLSAAGEMQQMRAAFSQYLLGLALAVVLVYLVLVAQFRSFVDPLVIMLSVVFGFIGVGVMLYATSTPLSIQSFMGIIMMVGIVVQYGIILVDFANARVREGKPIREAITDAAAVRVRPVLMTSLTTVLALLPMAVGFGGGDANMPLARTIIGGVLGAMVLTLFVLPCLYVILKRPPKRPDDTPEPIAQEPAHA